MRRHWSCLCYCQNKLAGDPRGPCGRPGARGHHVGDPCFRARLRNEFGSMASLKAAFSGWP